MSDTIQELKNELDKLKEQMEHHLFLAKVYEKHNNPFSRDLCNSKALHISYQIEKKQKEYESYLNQKK